MTTTLITDGFDGEDEPEEGRLYPDYRDEYTKQMTDIAKTLDLARRVYRINRKSQ